MATDPLHEKGKTLEDIFFAERDRELIAALRQKAAREQATIDLAALTGISDRAVLDRVTSLGVSPDTLAAFTLVPLLQVAWADGTLDHKEREAILIEATAIGLHEGSAGHQLLAGWLHREPEPSLFDAWKAYHAALAPHLSDADKAKLRGELLERAKRIARASGGVLGIGAVGKAEAEVIEKLEAMLA
jgi:hypothetical protein